MNIIANDVLLGVGFYTVPQAARLLHVPALNIRRWLGGYSYKHGASKHSLPPLWQPQLPRNEGRLELGFRDVMELRFIREFERVGLPLQVIRSCLNVAREIIEDDHPFSTGRFRTDGQTIFLEGVEKSGEEKMLDLKKKQYVIKRVIEQSFRDLDIEKDAVVRWRPFNGKKSIVVDPTRSFGQPISAEFGVPTIVLADAVKAEGSIARVARFYEVAAGVVRDAVKFESTLAAA